MKKQKRKIITNTYFDSIIKHLDQLSKLILWFCPKCLSIIENTYLIVWPFDQMPWRIFKETQLSIDIWMLFPKCDPRVKLSPSCLIVKFTVILLLKMNVLLSWEKQSHMVFLPEEQSLPLPLQYMIFLYWKHNLQVNLSGIVGYATFNFNISCMESMSCCFY